MQITIKNQVYDIYFGIDALRYVDNQYQVHDESSGNVNLNMMLGIGLGVLVSGLVAENPVSVADFISAGTNTLKSKPSKLAIDAFIGELLEEEKIGTFCQEAVDFLTRQPLTKKKTLAVVQELGTEEAAVEEPKTKKGSTATTKS